MGNGAHKPYSFSRRLQLIQEQVKSEWIKSINFDREKPELAVQNALVAAINILKEDPAQSDDPKNLMADCVYCVFNYASIFDKKRRLTVTHLDAIQLDDSVKKYFRENNLSDNEDKEESNYSIKIDSTDDKKLIKFIELTWRKRWEDYEDRRYDKENYLTTWNYYLQSLCSSPRPTGIVWDKTGLENDESYYPNDYFFLDENLNKILFTTIKVEEIIGKKFEDFVNSTNIKFNDVSYYLKEMIKIWKSCKPENKKYIESESLVYALQALKWGFGWWGGNAFISIPIRYGSIANVNTGVLSICTKKPLDHEKLNKWNLIAQTVFSTLLSLESEKNFKQQTSAITYRVGHPMKNRASAIASQVCGTMDVLADVIENFKKGTEVDISELTAILNDLERAKRLAISAKGLGNLANFLAPFAAGIGIEEIFEQKNKANWLQDKPIILGDLIKNVVSLAADTEVAYSTVTICFTQETDRLLRFKPLTNNTWLKQSLLEEIFLEMVNNALKHGQKVNNQVRLTIAVEKTPADDYCLTLTNVMPKNSSEFSRKKTPVNLSGAGGEALSALLLKHLEQGSLFTQISEEQEIVYFSYLIESLPLELI